MCHNSRHDQAGGSVDYYLVLGIAEDANEETIRSAFRALARRFHPDVGEGSSPVEFQRAREAYDTLVDPERRRRYDRQLRASRVQPVSVEELMISKSFAEPLFDSRRTSFRASGARAPIARSSFFDDLVEEFFAALNEDWLSGPRWR
jgi:curved DNA-binding protein CbpA